MRQNPTKRKEGLPKGLRCSPYVHAAFREVNKLKKRQKGGGWSLINRRSHTLCLCTVCFLHVISCPLVTVFIFIGSALMSECQLAADATSNKTRAFFFFHSSTDNESVTHSSLISPLFPEFRFLSFREFQRVAKNKCLIPLLFHSIEVNPRHEVLESLLHAFIKFHP